MRYAALVVFAISLGAAASSAQDWCARFTDEFVARTHGYGDWRVQSLDLDGPGGAEPVLYFRSSSYLSFWNGTSQQSLPPITTSVPGGHVWLNDWVEFDPDGPGPGTREIVFAGDFTHLGGTDRTPGVVETTGVGTYDGVRYGSLGKGLPNPVTAIAVHHDGVEASLFAASSGMIWRWDDVQFVPLWTCDSEVSALVSYDADDAGPQPPSLYAAGYFSMIGDYPARYFARWDGKHWMQVVSERQGRPERVLTFDPDAGGPRSTLLLATFSHSTFAEYYNALDAFDGDSWTTLLPRGGLIGTFATFDEDSEGPIPPRLYAAPVYFPGPTSEQPRVGRWDGAGWSEVGHLPTTVSLFYGLATFDFDGSGPRPKTVLGMSDPPVEWDGIRWAPFNTAPSASVSELRVLDIDGSGPQPAVLFAGGDFACIGGVFASGFALYDGQSWVGNDDARIFDASAAEYFDVDGPGPRQSQLIVSAKTTSTYRPGVSVWDGADWHLNAIGPFLNSGREPVRVGICRVDAENTASIPSKLIFYGGFTTAGSGLANRIASWDGTSLSPLGIGVGSGDPESFVTAVTIFDPDGPGPLPANLVAAGRFTTAGGSLAQNIAQWDGISWSSMGDGLSGSPPGYFQSDAVLALQLFDEEKDDSVPPALFASGVFNLSGDAIVTPLAKWDGQQWTAGGGGVFSPFGGTQVRALTVFDEDGGGPIRPALLVAGSFNYTGEDRRTFGHLARWDGHSWCTPDRGYDSQIYALATFDRDREGPEPPSMFIGGSLYGDWEGMRAVRHLNRWGCTDQPPEVCWGDADKNNRVELADIALVLTLWGDTFAPLSCNGRGDGDRDGTVAFADITAALQNFGLVCSRD